MNTQTYNDRTYILSHEPPKLLEPYMLDRKNGTFIIEPNFGTCIFVCLGVEGNNIYYGDGDYKSHKIFCKKIIGCSSK